MGSEDYYQKVSEMIQQDKANRPSPGPPRRVNLAPAHFGRFLRKVFVALIIAGALIYLADSLDFRVRKDAIGQATLRTYYAIGQKNGKTELAYQDPQQVSCANALFPHAGLSACWWLRRHPERRVDFFQPK